MTNTHLNYWKKYCSEPLELVENYQQAKADNFAGWCIHHRLEILPDGTRVYAKELIDQGLYFGRPASELIFMREPEHKRLHITIFNKGRTFSEETRKKLSKSHKGKHLSEEHRKKMSESLRGKHHSAETRLKIAEARKGKHLSEETRKKLSEALKGRQFSAETRLKMSEAHKGRHKSEESRNKIAEARKGMHWWNNGISNKCSRECPGEGWTRGFLSAKFKY